MTNRFERLKEAIENGLPKSAEVLVDDLEEALPALVELLDDRRQPQVESLVIGKADFTPSDEFPEEPVLSEADSNRLFDAFPNLKHLEVQGWAPFETFSHPSIVSLAIRGCASYQLDQGMVFPKLETLRWSDEIDSHGLSCFEHGGGLEWALNAKKTPLLIDIETTAAMGLQLNDESLPLKNEKTIQRLRLEHIYHDADFRVVPKVLELLDADPGEFKAGEIDLEVLARKYDMQIVHVDKAGKKTVLATPNAQPDIDRQAVSPATKTGASMMVIVSKAVFNKERDDLGKKLQLGSVWPADVYHSKNKSIAKNLTDDLYLVTVRDERLWLVAVLESPTHNGESWVGSENVAQISDVTDIASELMFTSGKGVNMEKMAMSLQTPRVLTDADCALLQSNVSVKKQTVGPTDQEKEDAVVWVLSQILERTEDDIRNDKKRYAAFHWDDGLVDFGEPETSLGWKEHEFCEDGAVHGQWCWGRSDFDPVRTLVNDTETNSEFMVDISARELAKTQSDWLYFGQFCTLYNAGRIQLDTPYVLGRIQSGDSLVEAAMALFRMTCDERELDDEFYEIDPDWEEMINAIAHPRLRHHLGFFFQEANTARCFGACFGSDLDIGFDTRYKEIASWWMGEGQGDCGLVHIIDDTVSDVPDATGVEPTWFEENIPPGKLPIESEADLAITSLHEHFVKHQEMWRFKPNLERYIAAIEHHDAAAVFHGIQVVEPYANTILDELHKATIVAEEFRIGFPIWDFFAGEMSQQCSHFALFQRGFSLLMLKAFEDAKQDFLKVMELLETFPDDRFPAFTHNNLAICYQRTDALELAKQHAEKAVALSDHVFLRASLGLIMFDMGDVDEAFENIEPAMKEGNNLYPRQPLSTHPRYRELCAKYRISVQRWD